MPNFDPLWLVPSPQRIETPHAYRAGKNIRPVEFVVVHWTASPPSKRSRHGDDPERLQRWLRGEGRESSTHFVVTRAGEVFQGASLAWRTWHAGGSVAPPPDGKGDINQRSIGIDLENVGHLVRGTGRWVDGYGGTYSGPPPHESPTTPEGRLEAWARRTIAQSRVRAWEPYRVAQMVAFLDVARALHQLFPAARWIGHAEIRDTKIDPGPHFPWRTLTRVLAGEVEPGGVDDWHPAERRLMVDA